MLNLKIEFDRILHTWDGFGVNYVETSMTRNYDVNPQDYGGFSTLSDEKQQQILDLIFGDNGLKPSLIKMFLDPFHQPEPDYSTNLELDPEKFDHVKTTPRMLKFVKEGLSRSKERASEMQVLTTMYCPPPWMTIQKIIRGRDLDPQFELQCAKYAVSFAKFLREKESIPVRYVSIHNEGEDSWRWPANGMDTPDEFIHDYNMYWSPESIASFIPKVRSILDANDMHDIGVSCGETTSWTNFYNWGYADALADSPDAVECLGLITSHGFAKYDLTRWWSDWRANGIQLVKQKKPDLHAWVTSTGWGKMDARFIWEIYNNIYGAGVNGIIPWACIQNHSVWHGGDPNPGCAFLVDGQGGYSVQPGYYFYKQVSRSGQPGMGVARVRTSETLVGVIAFAGLQTTHPDSFILINGYESDVDVTVDIQGTSTQNWCIHRTSPHENYVQTDSSVPHEQVKNMKLPAMSVTTLTAC